MCSQNFAQPETRRNGFWETTKIKTYKKTHINMHLSLCEAPFVESGQHILCLNSIQILLCLGAVVHAIEYMYGNMQGLLAFCSRLLKGRFQECFLRERNNRSTKLNLNSNKQITVEICVRDYLCVCICKLISIDGVESELNLHSQHSKCCSRAFIQYQSIRALVIIHISV